MALEDSRRVLVGVIAGAHGVRGEVRIRSFTGDPAAIGRYGPVGDESGQRRFNLRVVRAAKNAVIARITGIDDRTAAEALRGLRLYIDRAALPAPHPEEYYHADLIGLRVELADGTPFGVVVSVRNHGAGDVVEIRRHDGRSELMTFTRRTFPAVDVTAGRLVVAPPDIVVAGPEGTG